MSSEMIEKVARALCIRDGRIPEYLEPGDCPGGISCEEAMDIPDGYNGKDDFCHFLWRGYVPDAKAAIGAMREPTAKMLDHGEGYTDFILPAAIGVGKRARMDEMEIAWKVMIDIAMNKEHPPSKPISETHAELMQDPETRAAYLKEAALDDDPAVLEMAKGKVAEAEKEQDK